MSVSNLEDFLGLELVGLCRYMSQESALARISQIRSLILRGMDMKEAAAWCVNKSEVEIYAKIGALEAAASPILESKPSEPERRPRPTMDEYLIGILESLKTRAGCPRKQTAALVVDKDHVLLSTGYNGPPAGISNCVDSPCDGVADGTGNMTRCEALHAESNAIYFAGDQIQRAEKIYCLNLPCFKCALEILRTPIKQVVYVLEGSDERCRGLFEQKGVQLVKFTR